MLGAPELDAVLQVGSHESGVKGQKHLPRPAGQASFDAAVLGLARTGLIFTGNQEGTYLGRLSPPGQTEQGIPYHVRHAEFPSGEQGRRELRHCSGGRGGGAGELLCGLCCFVLCFLVTCIIVLPVPFVCCSVKLPLSQPTNFCLFLSILLRIPSRGGAAAWRFCCWPQ